jgi:hypothetical protein
MLVPHNDPRLALVACPDQRMCDLDPASRTPTGRPAVISYERMAFKGPSARGRGMVNVSLVHGWRNNRIRVASFIDCVYAAWLHAQHIQRICRGGRNTGQPAVVRALVESPPWAHPDMQVALVVGEALLLPEQRPAAGERTMPLKAQPHVTVGAKLGSCRGTRARTRGVVEVEARASQSALYPLHHARHAHGLGLRRRGVHGRAVGGGRGSSPRLA